MLLKRSDIDILRNTLRGYRVKAGLTQQTAAEALNVSVSTFNRWEQRPDKLPFDKFVQIADLYKVPVSDFFAAI